MQRVASTKQLFFFFLMAMDFQRWTAYICLVEGRHAFVFLVLFAVLHMFKINNIIFYFQFHLNLYHLMALWTKPPACKK